MKGIKVLSVVLLAAIAVLFVTTAITSQAHAQQWAKTYGGTSHDVANSIQQTSDGGYIVAGWTSSFGAGDWDFWVIKLDASGNVAWQKTYGGTSCDEAFSIQQTSDGGYIVAGLAGGPMRYLT
ncbi:MAG: hypothetical protein K6360_00495 [Deltaproteobacteria bacterium]